MIMRIVHLTVVASLIMAAAYVYKIKFESTVRAAELTRLADEIKRESDAIAALKAEWAQLESPARIQGLADRHLALKLLDPSQIDSFDHLPERPAPPGSQPDPIGAMIDTMDGEQAGQPEQRDGAPPLAAAPASGEAR